jgi:autotransporter-associated beta strand protein
MNERPVLSGVIRPIGLPFSVAFVFILLAFVLCAPHNSHAAIKTWDADSTAGDWNLQNNWNLNTAPVAGDDVLFDNTAQSPLEDIFLNAAQSINALTINLTAGPNQNWNLGADNSTSPFTLTLATGTISVLSTSGTGTYVIGATSGALIGTGTMTLTTTGTGFTFDNSRTNGGLLQINAIVSGANTVSKTGAGTVILTGANTYTGGTTINGGTLTAAASSGSALGSTSAITVNSGGTLLLGANNQINDTVPITLAGGTLAKGDFSEGSTSTAGVGALTLNATGSHLDFETGTVGTVTFASFTPGAFVLTINNWTGTANTIGNGATDRLIFDVSQSSNLGSFSFTGFEGATEFDLGNGYYEVTPLSAVPEPSTYFAGALALAALGYQQLRRLRRRRHRIRRWLPER